jgi:cyclopropane-fatty-acyl-phospholipid synthase
LAGRLREFGERAFSEFPWPIRVRDWTGACYAVGGDAPHWCDEPLQVIFPTEAAARALLAGDILGLLDRFVRGEWDLEGNLYVLPRIRAHARLDLKPHQMALSWLRHRAFQNPTRARANVKSHYDISQEALDVYLDRTYRSYSCGIFEDPEHLSRDELRRIGAGQGDEFDSLEKAQWRKFQDAVAFVAPRQGETLLDVGCGYGGQLQVALASHPFGRAVGWTHSANQAREGSKLLAPFAGDRWELNEGDYRQDDRVFDHVTSTGMISHVGRRGLAPYVRNVRRRIRKGGRYVHHALMEPAGTPRLDFQLGRVFNRTYVWPGFHWFTVGAHVKALEDNGFEVQRLQNLSPHYVKTTAAWYERMMAQRERVAAEMGDATFRAWRLFLAGSSGDLAQRGIHVYRIYCRAV